MLDKFKEKLTNMNRDIREAIRSADFEKAQALDNERQYFIITAMKDDAFTPDDEFVEFLENSSRLEPLSIQKTFSHLVCR